MIKRQIQDWLDKGGSFAQGCQLFDVAGGRSAVLDRLRKKRFVGSADKDILRKLLQDLAQAMPDSPAPTQLAEIALQEPTSILILREEGRKLKKRESFVHAHLVAEAFGEADHKKLYELAHEMMIDIHPRLDEVYDTIRDYERDGTLPPDEKQKVISEAVEKMSKRTNMRTRIYRLRKELKKKDLPDEDRQRYEAEIQEKETAIAEIEEFLGL